MDNIAIPASITAPVQGKVVDYNLYAIVVHAGTSGQFGHYYTFCKYGKRWLLFNDAMVTEAPDNFLVNLAE